MNDVTTAARSPASLNDWTDPFEQAIREGVQRFAQELLEAEVSEVLGRLRYWVRCSAGR